MKTKIETESPLSIKEQIEVLEAAKVVLVPSSVCPSCVGLCRAISLVIKKKHNHLYSLVVYNGVRTVIPSFTFESVVLSGMVSDDAAPGWYWWSTEVSKGGITNRLAFLDWLIEQLKEAIA